MLAERLELRNFRNYERAEVELGEGLTMVTGRNGAGKTNLLEGLYFALTGRSCRTSSEREVVRYGAPAARAMARTRDDEGASHALEVGYEPGEPKQIRVDGSAVEGVSDPALRPLVNVFIPDRLALVKGAPSVRRAHLDQLAATLWPARAGERAAYARALAQRNAALARVRTGGAPPSLLDPWDAELARIGLDLMRARAEASGRLRPSFAARAAELGLPSADLGYRPCSTARDVDELHAEMVERRGSDLERGFTGHGPHRDDLALRHEGRALRAFGSQGQQRVGLLALLFAERDLLLERGRPPLMLLDDVASELDADRRERLAALVHAGGQVVISATEIEHVPRGGDAGVARVEVESGRVVSRPRLAAA